MSCCHYDEGYEDGKRHAEQDGVDAGDISQAIRDAAQLIFDRRGDYETADVLRTCAEEIAVTRGFSAWCLTLRNRETELLKSWKAA